MPLGSRSRAFSNHRFSRSRPIDSMGHSRASLHFTAVARGRPRQGRREQPRRNSIYRLGARIRSGCRPSSRSRRRQSNSRSCLRPPDICRSCVCMSFSSPLVHHWTRMNQVLTQKFDIGLLSPLSHAVNAACADPSRAEKSPRLRAPSLRAPEFSDSQPCSALLR